MRIPWYKDNMKYNIEYFIKIFSDVPDSYWSLSSVMDPTDAWEWLVDIREQEALYDIVQPWGLLLAANDGLGRFATMGNSPKERVLAFLNYIKKREHNVP